MFMCCGYAKIFSAPSFRILWIRPWRCHLWILNFLAWPFILEKRYSEVSFKWKLTIHTVENRIFTYYNILVLCGFHIISTVYFFLKIYYFKFFCFYFQGNTVQRRQKGNIPRHPPPFELFLSLRCAIVSGKVALLSTIVFRKWQLSGRK